MGFFFLSTVIFLKALEQSSARGIFIGLILALSTLVIATNNVIISTLATLNIMLVVGSFAGCIKFFGWSVSVSVAR